MIEKIMKAVKRGNKKRSRNITIGAVIGFLLSCTAVMGAADGNYLFIKDDSGIKFSTDGNAWDNTNPYEDVENTWDENTYINNTILSVNGTGVNAYGVKLELNSPNFKFINNGTINGSSDSKIAYGIYSDSGEVESIENDGIINGNSRNGSSIGIHNGGTVTKIINRGIINDEIRPNTLTNKVSSTGIRIDGSLAKVEKIINIYESTKKEIQLSLSYKAQKRKV